MRTNTLASLGAIVLSLSACGGGGGSIASAPAPAVPPAPSPAPSPSPAPQRTPLPATPATTSGAYQGISTVQSLKFPGDASATQFQQAETVVPLQIAPAGSVTLGIDASSRTYTLTVTAGAYQFAPGQVVMPENAEIGYTRNNPIGGTPAEQAARGDMLAKTVPAGTTDSGAQRALTTFVRLFNVGQQNGSPRYLSAAQWGQFYQENVSGAPSPENFKVTEETMGQMVFGQRTAPGDIPPNGIARYALRSIISSDGCSPDASDCSGVSESKFLDADFGKRSLSATYEISNREDVFETDEEGWPIEDENGSRNLLGTATRTIRTSGTAPLASSGDFTIAISGTGSVHTELTGEPPVADITKPVSGLITGAFFGPQAAEVGGIWTVPWIATDGSVGTITDAFAGQRTSP